MERYALTRKRSSIEKEATQSYRYLVREEPEKADVLFFAGCMTHPDPFGDSCDEKDYGECRVRYRFMDEKEVYVRPAVDACRKGQGSP
ncbi:MAG: hypothetical protein R2758_06085 [Bacteroidales bacterium]